jgi:hypothetical protein
LPRRLGMSSFRLKHNIGDTLADDDEIVVVTTKQYRAVADDFIRWLFPELTPDLLPRIGAFTVFVTDEDDVVH